MVTRNIKANTAAQVNANLIGVQIRTRSERLVNGIYVDYRYTVKGLTQYVKYEDKDGSYRPSDSGLSTVMVRSEDPEQTGLYILGVYFYDGTSEYDGDGNEYKKILKVPYADNHMWVKVSSVPGDNLYDLNWDETIQAYVATSRNEEFFNDVTVNKEVCQSTINRFVDTSGANYSYTTIYNPEIEVLQHLGTYGLVYHTSTVTKEQYFSKTGSTSTSFGKIYYYWDGEGSGYPVYGGSNKTGVGTDIIWNEVNAGDAVIYRYQNSTYNPMTIKSVDDEIVTDPINCTLSYSVDGKTWTEWPENMTDANNVISNIPRYMYLKFSQDVVITEE